MPPESGPHRPQPRDQGYPRNRGRSILILAFDVLVLSRFVSQNFVMFVAKLSKEDLTILRGLMEAGKVTPVIDRRYTLTEVPQAIRYLEKGHARGKVVITLEQNN
jgi:NADPH:quinone reductase-like Zn-dependent oxidoreductase